MSEAAFQARPELRSHLGRECIRGLRKQFFQPVITDAYANRALKGGELLAVGIAFAQWLKKNVPEKRVGVVLPPGLGATVANLGLVLADKIPVNLNFTAGRAANESAIARAGIQRLITAPAMMEQVKDFPVAGEPHRPRRHAEEFPAQAAQALGRARARLAGVRCSRAGSSLPRDGRPRGMRAALHQRQRGRAEGRRAHAPQHHRATSRRSAPSSRRSTSIPSSAACRPSTASASPSRSGGRCSAARASSPIPPARHAEAGRDDREAPASNCSSPRRPSCAPSCARRSRSSCARSRWS